MKRTLVTAITTFAITSVLLLGVGASGVTNNLTLRAGNSEGITCPNALTYTNVKAKSETVNCATAPPRSTTTTTLPKRPATTTTTTTAPKPPATTTTTTTTTTSAGGACSSLAFSSSQAEATYNPDPDDGYQYYWVNNDLWSGSHGPQTINVCNQSSWYAASNQPDVGGQVETYPDTEYDVGGRDNPSTTPISGFKSITSTFSELNAPGGGWDAAYDLWTDNWSNETMIWNQWAGSNAFWADCANAADSETYCGTEQGVALTLDGVPYHFLANGPKNADGTPIPCTPQNESQCEYMFFRDTQVSSGSVDLLAAFQWEVAHGYASASDIPTQLEYGTEVSYTSGTETFAVNGLTFSLSQ
jgi:hypothetical protein